MGPDLLRKLADILERQPDTKQGYFNQFVAIKRIARDTKEELDEIYRTIREEKEELKRALKEQEQADIKHNAYTEYINSAKRYINRQEEFKQSMERLRASTGMQLEDILQKFAEYGVTDHELAQLVGCPVENVKEARREYEEYKQDKGGKKVNMNFYRYAIDIYNIERRDRELGWKEGALFELLTDLLMWFIYNNPEVKEKTDKWMNRFLLENDITTYKMNEDGELEECPPDPQLVVDNT